MIYKVGSRKSKLAMVQTEYVIGRLKEHFPEDEFEIVTITTTGDVITDRALDAIGSKGVFVDEIEKELLEGKIHMAVHSMKDMPEEPAEGLCFADAWPREDASDVLILREAASLRELPKGAVLGTGSRRRCFQLKALRPDLEFVPIRGNVDTRIRKLLEPLPDGRSLDGIVLAAAGIKRLGRSSEITEVLSFSEMIPAPAQGILAIETRTDALELLEKINQLSDAAAVDAVRAERSFLKAMGGDCHLPVGAYLDESGDEHAFYGLFGSEDGEKLAKTCIKAEPGESVDSLVERAVQDIRTKLGALR